MKIKIFNTLTRKKEIFEPIDKDCINMYVCGPTVYSNPHIGNARAALIPDIFFRLLKKAYKKINYIRNITDVDDKILDAAAQESKTVYEISKKYTKMHALSELVELNFRFNYICTISFDHVCFFFFGIRKI